VLENPGGTPLDRLLRRPLNVSHRSRACSAMYMSVASSIQDIKPANGIAKHYVVR
jgi:hypothetical protein